jgi:regulator of protease activity HflC (stomatin/prohibitin superfamily)
MYLDENGEPKFGRIIWHLITASIFVIVLAMAGCPTYHVYCEKLNGEALLAHAQSSKEVAVAEAKAKMESAELLAQAEIKRAEGVAKANEIIGLSLKNNESYLRYLWITEVANNQQGKTVVYIPTEANLPILEANRFEGKR